MLLLLVLLVSSLYLDRKSGPQHRSAGGSISFKLALDSQCNVGSPTPEPQPQGTTEED